MRAATRRCSCCSTCSGWDINSKLAVGMGLPPARIDLPSFITAANACDESITLNGGGTEPRYRTDGVLSEGDDRQAVIESLCSMMNATLRDAGGKLALTVLNNDLASPVASFTEADILEGGNGRRRRR
jgi:predicted phage tail protein